MLGAKPSRGQALWQSHVWTEDKDLKLGHEEIECGWRKAREALRKGDSC